jgi:hypothetical protein
MMTVLYRNVRTILATLVVLSVPTYAVCSLLQCSAGRAPEAELARGDDPIRNGLRIVDPPGGSSNSVSAHPKGAEEVLVTDWTFTDGGGKGKPSPYH